MNNDKKKSARSKVNWIAGALSNHKPGELHRDLGVPKGKKIPAVTLASAAKDAGKVGKRARLAITLRKLNH